MGAKLEPSVRMLISLLIDSKIIASRGIFMAKCFKHHFADRMDAARSKPPKIVLTLPPCDYFRQVGESRFDVNITATSG